MSFSEYVSLGGEYGGCEVGYQIKRASGHDGGFLSWRGVLLPDLIRGLQTGFAGAFRSRAPDPEYGNMREPAYGIRYHPLDTIEEDRAKAAHQIDKLMRPTPKRCYIRKQVEPVSKVELVALMAALDVIHPDYMLVLVRAAGSEQDIGARKVCERTVTHFAPLGDTEDVDAYGWRCVFAGFRLHQMAFAA